MIYAYIEFASEGKKKLLAIFWKFYLNNWFSNHQIYFVFVSYRFRQLFYQYDVVQKLKRMYQEIRERSIKQSVDAGGPMRELPERWDYSVKGLREVSNSGVNETHSENAKGFVVLVAFATLLITLASKILHIIFNVLLGIDQNRFLSHRLAGIICSESKFI